MARLSILAIAAIAIFAAGCGGDSGSAAATTSGAAQSQQGDAAGNQSEAAKGEASAASAAATVAGRRSRPGKKLTAVGSQFGRVVADGRGEALYLFGKERGKRSRCYGACARAWPPVITRGKPRAGKGVRARLLGATKRRNGKRQVTYKNHPLYYYVEDSPGTILCQNVAQFGGLWLLVKPNGNPVN